MSKPLLPVALVAVSLLLAACSTTPPIRSVTPAGAGSLVGPTWLVDALSDDAPASGTTVTAEFAADGTVSGSGGCNRYSGRYTVSGATIAFDGALASTMMACETPVMAQEAAYFAALTAARGFTVTADRLSLSGEDAGVLVSFLASDQSLAGTAWKVTAYHDGADAVVSVVTGSSPTVAFGADGAVSGSGGCNRLVGTFTADDGAVTIGPLGTTKMACQTPTGVMEQEVALVAALESAATYAIEGDRLELRTAGDGLAVQLTRG